MCETNLCKSRVLHPHSLISDSCIYIRILNLRHITIHTNEWITIEVCYIHHGICHMLIFFALEQFRLKCACACTLSMYVKGREDSAWGYRFLSPLKKFKITNYIDLYVK